MADLTAGFSARASTPHARRSFWPSFWRAVGAGLRNRLRRWREGRDRRDAFERLSQMDDRQLRDIGLSRSDLDWAGNLPVRFDATEALHRRVGERLGAEGRRLRR